MVMSLFSIFDPQSLFLMNLNWVIMLIPIMALISKFWLINNKSVKMMTMLYAFINKEVSSIIGTYYTSINLLMISTLFTQIMMMNMYGLIPYIFNSTSHMSITMSISLPLWLSCMIMGWKTMPKFMFNHLLPQGTPSALMPFMIMIEIISSVIRPFTLAIRLMANMIAGHLLMTLLGNLIAISTMIPSYMLLLIQVTLILLELAVSMIQAYVFSILTSLYISEVQF